LPLTTIVFPKNSGLKIGEMSLGQPGHGAYQPGVLGRLGLATWPAVAEEGLVVPHGRGHGAVEVNEPGLGLNLAPGAAERFANALLARLGRP
jgi:hypothetical protein